MPNSNKADVLIFTVTRDESVAVLNTFKQATGIDNKSITIGDRTYRDLGIVNGTKVFMALSEMGAGGLGAAQQAVQKGIEALKPHSVIMVGIAFGINEQKQTIGDILVARQLMCYESQRIGAGEIIARGDKAHSSTRLVNYLQNAHLDWTGAEVEFGLVLTGEKLVDNLDYRESLRQLASEAIGGEMEGAGLYVSCHDAKVDWILVKAICDWADGNKTQDKKQRQKLAAENAASFIVHALQHAPLPRLTTTHSINSDKAIINDSITIKAENYIEGNVSNSNIAGRDITIYNFASQSKQDTIQPQLFNNLPPLDISFIGRITELETLNNALNSNQISIFCIIAAGGIGKTSLIQKWLNELNQTDYKIFAWSFYNQGANDDSQTSSIPFFNEAFKFFNYQGENIIDEQQRGRELATLIKTQNTILILDGLEPLQHSPQADNGSLKDLAIHAFLTRILNEPINDNSLILISTRQPLTRFIDKKSYQAIDLLKLEKKDAIQLVKNLGVTKGTNQEFSDAVNFYGCHALALMLLGRMLVNYFEQDIRYYREIPLLEEETQGKHAEKVLNFYFNRWQDNEPEKLFLYLLGLFDRPMNEDEKTELFNKASIAQPLAQLTTLELKQTIKRLRDLKLLSDDKNYYDCHPIIRNYFGLKFKENNNELFKQAHLVLFEYYQGIPEKEFGKYLPDTLEEMLPLYRAVVYGCLADKYGQAFEVYKVRICREYEYYSQHNLGAYADEFTALSTFFPQGLEYPLHAILIEENQAWIYAETSFCLMSLGRLKEAVEPRKMHLSLFEKLKDWANAARAAQNLVDLYVSLSLLVKANSVALKSVEYAKRSGNIEQLKRSQSCLGVALYHSADLDNALVCFEHAELLAQSEGCKYLAQTYGVDYCFTILQTCKDKTKLQNLIRRAEYGLLTSKKQNHLICIAFYKLIIRLVASLN
jgi:nucleoside phosphorylase/AAA+ ATPase superfamily predicted ATPase